MRCQCECSALLRDTVAAECALSGIAMFFIGREEARAVEIGVKCI